MLVEKGFFKPGKEVLTVLMW